MQNLLLYFILAFIFLDLVIVIIIFLKRKKGRISPKDMEFVKITWYRILDYFPANPQKSIMDADKLLDFVLSRYGKTGNLGEKLKQSNKLFSDINSVWEAHKLRNKFAHEIKEPDKKQTKNALQNYKKALIELGIDL